MDRPKFFFSYARKDSDFVLRLAQELRAVGAELWLDQLDIRGGQRWDRAIEEALKICPGMLVVLSPESLASNNVMDEVSYALEEGKLLIPILLRPCEVPFRLRRVQHVDFTASYGAGFERLLKALQITRQPEKLLRTPAERGNLLIPTTMVGAEAARSQLPKFADPIEVGPELAGKSAPKKSLPRWVRGLRIGFAVGVAYAGLGIFRSPIEHSAGAGTIYAACLGALGGLTGALAWKNRILSLAPLIGLVIGFTGIAISARSYSDWFDAAFLFGGPVGAFLGTLLGATIEDMVTQRKSS